MRPKTHYLRIVPEGPGVEGEQLMASRCADDHSAVRRLSKALLLQMRTCNISKGRATIGRMLGAELQSFSVSL